MKITGTNHLNNKVENKHKIPPMSLAMNSISNNIFAFAADDLPPKYEEVVTTQHPQQQQPQVHQPQNHPQRSAF